MTYVDIGMKLFFGLIALLVVTRLLGKKEMSQLTPFDFIYSLVLSGILVERIYDDKVSTLHVWFLAYLGSNVVSHRKVIEALR